MLPSEAGFRKAPAHIGEGHGPPDDRTRHRDRRRPRQGRHADPVEVGAKRGVAGLVVRAEKGQRLLDFELWAGEVRQTETRVGAADIPNDGEI